MMKEERKKDKHNCVRTHFVLSPCLRICLCVVMCCQRANASYAQRRIQGKLYLYALCSSTEHPSIHPSKIIVNFMWICRMREMYPRAHASGSMSTHTAVQMLMQVRTHACRRLQTCTDNILRQMNFRQNHLKSSESGDIYGYLA